MLEICKICNTQTAVLDTSMYLFFFCTVYIQQYFTFKTVVIIKSVEGSNAMSWEIHDNSQVNGRPIHVRLEKMDTGAGLEPVALGNSRPNDHLDQEGTSKHNLHTHSSHPFMTIL